MSLLHLHFFLRLPHFFRVFLCLLSFLSLLCFPTPDFLLPSLFLPLFFYSFFGVFPSLPSLSYRTVLFFLRCLPLPSLFLPLLFYSFFGVLLCLLLLTLPFYSSFCIFFFGVFLCLLFPSFHFPAFLFLTPSFPLP